LMGLSNPSALFRRCWLSSVHSQGDAGLRKGRPCPFSIRSERDQGFGSRAGVWS
jgi:hypothetical protein